MGTTTQSAFNDLVVALGRQSAPILDNLGIIVKTEAANEAYAKSLGKTVTQLTSAEKKQAFMNAALDTGAEALTRQNLALTTYAEKMEQMRVLAKNVELFFGQIIVRGGTAIVGMLQAVASWFVNVLSGVLFVFATLEAKARAAGLTTSTFFLEAYNTVREAANSLSSNASVAFDLAMKSAMDFAMVVGGASDKSVIASESIKEAAALSANSLEAMNKKIEGYKKQLEALVPGSRQYMDVQMQLMTLEKQISDARDLAVIQFERGNIKMGFVTTRTLDEMAKAWKKYYAAIKLEGVKEVEFARGLTEEMQEELQRRMEIITSVMYGTATALADTFTAMFQNQEAIGKKFLKSIALMVIDLVQTLLLAASVAALAKGVLTFGFSALTDAPLIAAATIGLQLLRAFIAEKFHEGGIVPRRGGALYMDASPNEDIPILVRGGETIRTEEQEAALQSGGGSTVNIYVNGPVATPQAFKEIIERGMRELGVTDVSKYFRNTRNNLVLES